MIVKNPDISKIRKAIQKSQDSKRYEHTLGVAYTASALAMHYGADINNALIAGYLHDCAKSLSDEKKLAFCEKYNIPVTETEAKNPSLLHAKVGGFMAMDTYNIKDIDIINAILNHTTGRPEMSVLEKIIYIADYIEPGRKQAPNLSEIRKMAFVDLDHTILKILGDTLEYLKNSDMVIDLKTQKTFEYYETVCNEKAVPEV